jgi:hypothetical protein
MRICHVATRPPLSRLIDHPDPSFGDGRVMSYACRAARSTESEQLSAMQHAVITPRRFTLDLIAAYGGCRKAARSLRSAPMRRRQL